MDVVSHGLWGGLAFGRTNKKYYWLAFLFGILSDVLSFGLLMIANILNIGTQVSWSEAPTNADIPTYVHVFYNITHSLIVFAVVFSIVWLIRKRPFIPLLAWPFHIVLDIFTHSTAFFATPFLWPLFSYKFNGISWGHPWIFFPNWITIIIGYSFWYMKKRQSLKGKTVN